MFEHLSSHQTALPPTSAGPAYDRRQPRVQNVPRASTVAWTVILSALVVVFALALIATMPAAVVAPTAILLVGGLIAGSLAMRAREMHTRWRVTGRRRRTHRDLPAMGRYS